MKIKLVAIISAFVFLFVDCSFEQSGLDLKKDNVSDNNIRTECDAVSIAVRYGQLLRDSACTRSQVLSVSSVEALTSDNTRSCEDTLMYAVNFSDDTGYIIVSADRTAEPILAMIDDGHYDKNLMERNPAFSSFMKKAKAYVEGKRSLSQSRMSIVKPTDPNPGPVDFIMQRYSDTIKNVYKSGPRVNVNWGQYWPENIYCPNRIAGCAPVAIAQLLSYFRPSMDFDLTFDNRPVAHLNIDWTGLLLHTASTKQQNLSAEQEANHMSRCRASKDSHENLAVLVRQIGEWSGSNYELMVTNTDTVKCFRLSNDILADKRKIRLQKNEYFDNLQDSGVALVGGFNHPAGGHMWVMDGIATVTVVVNTYYNYNPVTHEYAKMTTSTDKSKYIHCNWGWDGTDNGYVLENVYDPDESVPSLDTKSLDLSDKMRGIVYK